MTAYCITAAEDTGPGLKSAESGHETIRHEAHAREGEPGRVRQIGFTTVFFACLFQFWDGGWGQGRRSPPEAGTSRHQGGKEGGRAMREDNVFPAGPNATPRLLLPSSPYP